VTECSDIDDIIVFRQNGTFIVTKVSDKVFVGQEIIHIAVFNKNDERTVYNLIYRDGKNGKTRVKRFNVMGVTRDKEYFITKGTPDSRVLYFSANPNGEAEIVRVELRPKPRLKKLNFDFDFTTVAIKGRASQGNILTRYGVRKIEQRQEGVSTLGSRLIWYDDTVKRLNTEERGILLSEFSGTDRIVTIMQSGHYRLTSFDLSTHFDEDMILIEKYNPEKVFTAVYEDTKTRLFYVKRFIIEVTERKMDFIGEEEKNRLVLLTGDKYPRIDVAFDMKVKTKGAEKEEITVHEFIGVKGFKAKGKRISHHAVKKIEFLEPIQIEEPVPIIPIENGELRMEDGERRSEVGGLKSEEGRMKNEDGRMKNEERKVKNEKGKVKDEDGGRKKEDGNVKIEDGKMKDEKGRMRKEKGKGKEKNKEETSGDKKKEDSGDAMQMELPL
jgi:topoisomerase-4 subunit A